MKRKIVNKYTYKGSKGKSNFGKSMTLKNEAYSVREIMYKFANGMELGVHKTPHYADDVNHDSIDIEEFNRLDNVEKQEIIELTKSTADRLKEAIEYERELMKAEEKIQDDEKRSEAEDKSS